MKRSPIGRKTPLRAKPPARPPRERPPLVLSPRSPGAPRAVMALASPIGEAVPKEGRHISEAWRRAVASLPCCACGKTGETQCAHANHRGKGMGLKAPDCLTFPLCVACHREFDQGKSFTREQRRQLADDWIIKTITELAGRGLIRA